LKHKRLTNTKDHQPPVIFNEIEVYLSECLGPFNDLIFFLGFFKALVIDIYATQTASGNKNLIWSGGKGVSPSCIMNLATFLSVKLSFLG